MLLLSVFITNYPIYNFHSIQNSIIYRDFHFFHNINDREYSKFKVLLDVPDFVHLSLSSQVNKKKFALWNSQGDFMQIFIPSLNGETFNLDIYPFEIQSPL
jgi:hypothetical protein